MRPPSKSQQKCSHFIFFILLWERKLCVTTSQMAEGLYWNVTSSVLLWEEVKRELTEIPLVTSVCPHLSLAPRHVEPRNYIHIFQTWVAQGTAQHVLNTLTWNLLFILLAAFDTFSSPNSMITWPKEDLYGVCIALYHYYVIILLHLLLYH